MTTAVEAGSQTHEEHRLESRRPGERTWRFHRPSEPGHHSAHRERVEQARARQEARLGPQGWAFRIRTRTVTTILGDWR